MSSLINVPENIRRVMGMLRRAADAGAPCPSNNEICFAIGMESPASGARAISLLETMNLISVQRGSCSRVVTILATGKRTAGRVSKARNYQTKRLKLTGRSRYDSWSEAADGLLMERIAEGDDFEQAAWLLGKTANAAAARFDFLAQKFGSQAQ